MRLIRELSGTLFEKSPVIAVAVVAIIVALTCAVVGGLLVSVDYARKKRRKRSGASIGAMMIGAMLLAGGNALQNFVFTLVGIAGVSSGLVLLMLVRMFLPSPTPGGINSINSTINHHDGDNERSVGLPMRTPSETAPLTPSRAIFISYRREDSIDVTGRIYDRLVQHFGKHAVFKDVDSIPFGVDFRKHLKDVIERCDVLLAIVGDHWLTVTHPDGHRRLDDEHDFVRIELESALQRDITVVPVLIKGAIMPQEQVLPPSLRDFAYRNGTVVRHDPDFHPDMDRLIKSIEQH